MSRPILPTTSISSVPSLQSQSSHSPNQSFRVLSTSSSKGKERAVEIPENGLLVPTDRDRDELEGKWLHQLGRLQVHSELKLQGYSLYSLRTWYVLLHKVMCRHGNWWKVLVKNTLGTDYSYPDWTSGSGISIILNDMRGSDDRYRFIYSYQIPNYPIDKLKKSWKKQLGTWLMNQEIIPLSVER